MVNDLKNTVRNDLTTAAVLAQVNNLKNTVRGLYF